MTDNKKDLFISMLDYADANGIGYSLHVNKGMTVEIMKHTVKYDTSGLYIDGKELAKETLGGILDGLSR